MYIEDRNHPSEQVMGKYQQVFVGYTSSRLLSSFIQIYPDLLNF